MRKQKNSIAGFIAVLYVVAIAAGVYATNAKGKPVESRYAIAKRLVEQKKFPEAIAEYSKLLTANPRDSAARLGLAEAFLLSNQAQASMVECNKVLQREPENPDALLVRAKVKFYQKDPGAVDDINKSIKLNPRRAESYEERAQMYYFLGTIDSSMDYSSAAYKDCAKAIELNPRSGKAYNFRGIFQAENRKYKDAIVSFSKAIEIDPNDQSSLKYRGMAYSVSKQYDAALKDCNSILKIHGAYSLRVAIS